MPLSATGKMLFLLRCLAFHSCSMSLCLVSSHFKELTRLISQSEHLKTRVLFFLFDLRAMNNYNLSSPPKQPMVVCFVRHQSTYCLEFWKIVLALKTVLLSVLHAPYSLHPACWDLSFLPPQRHYLLCKA